MADQAKDSYREFSPTLVDEGRSESRRRHVIYVEVLDPGPGIRLVGKGLRREGDGEAEREDEIEPQRWHEMQEVTLVCAQFRRDWSVLVENRWEPFSVDE